MNRTSSCLPSRGALLVGLMLIVPLSPAQAQVLTSPTTTTQNGGNFASVTVNNTGNLSFSNGSVGANFLFPGTVTVNSGAPLSELTSHLPRAGVRPD
jgi:hypothetical protein